MDYDLIIRNGTVVDGTGAAPVRADIAIADGKIQEIGTIKTRARSVIDAAERIVAPGFIDPHTHYDAQICWDPSITPSSWHGVTTVVAGNCGVGLAPCHPDKHGITMRDLVLVEAIPVEVLEKGVTWEWETFPEYMDAAKRRGSALNLAFLAPLTPFRHYVMGPASSERAANREETQRIRELLKAAVQGGAFGFSTSRLKQHIGYDGNALGCRLASREELSAYASVLRELNKGAIEIALTQATSVLTDEEYEILDLLLTESGRPVTWLALFDRDDQPEACQNTLRKAEPLRHRGSLPQTSVFPLQREMSLRNPYTLTSCPSLAPIFRSTDEEKLRIYSDPAFRSAFRRDLAENRAFRTSWDKVVVGKVADPAMHRYEARSVAEIAQERGKDPLDTFLDLAIEDHLNLEYSIGIFHLTEKRVAELLTHPGTLLGLSDAGAHVDTMSDAGFSGCLLGKWVREREVMSLERAIYKMTAQPADLFGIRDRGRLRPGLAADIVIFDMKTIAARPLVRRDDLPGGARRFVAPSTGVDYTIVNGTVVCRNGAMTGERPGSVLRS